MDGIALVHKPRTAVPAVPYLEDARFKYKGPFANFHERVPQEAFSSSSPKTAKQNYSSFVQSWLFFGLLEEFFSAAGLPTERIRSDFVKKNGSEEVVTASLLIEYIIAYLCETWSKLMITLPLTPAKRVKEAYLAQPERVAKLHSLLQQTHVALHAHIRKEMVLAPVWDSVILLADSLSRAKHSIMPSFRQHGFEENRQLVDFSQFRFRSFLDLRDDKSWCPHERGLIPGFVDGQLAAIALFSQLDMRALHVSHTRCTAHECAAYHVERQTYEIPHAAGCSKQGCAMVSLEAGGQGSDDNSEPAVKIVQAVTFENDRLARVFVNTDDSFLVAISHVWADGLGNPMANEMRACQLRLLQERVNKVIPKAKRTVPFWIDTLMIPIVPKGLTGAQKARASTTKKLALGNMERVYKDADRVLVLDGDLTIRNASSMKLEELGARIMSSVWSRRLWTLQEGCSKDKTVFQFSDGAVSWLEKEEKEFRIGKLAGWRHVFSKLPKNHPLRQYQQWIDVGDPEKSHILKRIVRLVMGLAMTAAGDADMAHDRLLLNPVWLPIRVFLEEMTTNWLGQARGDMLFSCLRGMHYRSSSRPSDEVLVFASMLSQLAGSTDELVDVGGAGGGTLKIVSDDGDNNEDPYQRRRKDKRYCNLFQKLTDVPVELLFLDQDRYQTEDGKECRWIPTSLCSSESAKWRPRRPEGDGAMRVGQSPSFMTRSEDTCLHTDTGLVTHLDGLRLQPARRSVPPRFRFLHRRGDNTEDFWAASLRRPGYPSDETVQARPSAEWIIIPEMDFRGSPSICAAALVRMLKPAPTGLGGTTRFECLVALTPMKKDDFNASPLPLIDLTYRVRHSYSFDGTEIADLIVRQGKWQQLKTLGKIGWQAIKENSLEAETWVVG